MKTALTALTGNDAYLAETIIERKMRHVEDWQEDSSVPLEKMGTDSPPSADLTSANIVTSEAAALPGVHRPVLDIDINHVYVPSSTEGHGHLYLNLDVDHAKWEQLMTTLYECGIIQEGYYQASLNRGYSAVRVPWVKKDKPNFPDDYFDVNAEGWTAD